MTVPPFVGKMPEPPEPAPEPPKRAKDSGTWWGIPKPHCPPGAITIIMVNDRGVFQKRWVTFELLEDESVAGRVLLDMALSVFHAELP